MGKVYDGITPKLADWISQQRVFFVATAPLAAEGHVNCSPKGLDCFRVLGPRSVAYLDLTGSGIETVAHLRENGRIVLMFCAFDGPPKVLRLHGIGRALTPNEPAFNDLRQQFRESPGVRSLIHIDVTRISDSCGFGVPLFQPAADRDTLPKWHAAKGEPELQKYRETKNAMSIDGLPGVTRSSPVSPAPDIPYPRV